MEVGWRAGRRDIWRGGERIAEVVSSDWADIAPLMASAPDLRDSLRSMIEAFLTARENSVHVRLRNQRALNDATALLARLTK